MYNASLMTSGFIVSWKSMCDTVSQCPQSHASSSGISSLFRSLASTLNHLCKRSGQSFLIFLLFLHAIMFSKSNPRILYSDTSPFYQQIDGLTCLLTTSLPKDRFRCYLFLFFVAFKFSFYHLRIF